MKEQYEMIAKYFKKENETVDKLMQYGVNSKEYQLSKIELIKLKKEIKESL